MKRAMIVAPLLLTLAACMPAAEMPPPPPPPAPAAAMPPAGNHVFTVYFGWDHAWVGPAGMAVLRQAADLYHAGGIATVKIIGHTDTSGSAGYNRRLSQRRAKNVGEILAGMGVPRGAMTLAGEGETDLAVPTPDGVADPHNRRVAIVE